LSILALEMGTGVRERHHKESNVSSHRRQLLDQERRTTVGESAWMASVHRAPFTQCVYTVDWVMGTAFGLQ